MSILDAPAGRDEVTALYRLLLGREPESAAVVEAHAGTPLGALIAGFLDSEERARRTIGLLNDRYRIDWPGGAVDLATTPDELTALFETARRTWSQLGEAEPYWSVMTDPAYRAGAMDAGAEARFFESGAVDVEAFAAACGRNGIALGRSARVLDFGCGVGRLGVHLARRFDDYLGVDISPPHLAEAEVRIGPVSGRAAFRLLPEFLAGDDRYDVLFSVLVLQHNAPPVMAGLLRQLVDRLRPGGIGYVQIPHVLHGYAYSAAGHLADPLPVGEMEMHALPQAEVFRLLGEAGARPVEALADGRAGAAGLSTTWLFVKD